MGIQLKKNGKEVGERIDFLCEVTTALLDEVKALALLKNSKLDSYINFKEEVKKFEIYLIERALEKTGGNQVGAARFLKIKTTTLNSKIKRYDIRSAKSYKKPVFLTNPGEESREVKEKPWALKLAAFSLSKITFILFHLVIY